MFGLVHSFIISYLITNTDHVSSCLLHRRMTHFYHGPFALGMVDKGSMLCRLTSHYFLHTKGDDLTNPAYAHVPDLQQFKSLLDIVILCSINIFINALNGWTYKQDNVIPIEEQIS